MTSEIISFKVGDETLTGTIDWSPAKTKPSVLSLHGGGDGGRTRITPITEMLAAHGLSSMRFDHSGHGDSTGELKKSSLAKRTAEALAAAEFLDKTQPITLIGTSMGGPIALKLLKHLNVKTLVLFCPALYAKDAFDLVFDQGFTGIIREPNNFLRADMIALENFTGGFLHFIGNKDAIIPSGVTELYQHSSHKAEPHDFIELENAPHTLHSWMNDNPAVRQAVVNMILEFIAHGD